MSQSKQSIPGSIIVVGLDARGAAIIVPMQAGRAQFTSAGIDETGVYLAALDGSLHYLEGADPEIAREALNQDVIVVREINVVQPGGPVEYPIEVQAPSSPGLFA